MYKHYLRLDSENYIIKGFSDAFPETIEETDILLRETEQRQFYFSDFIFNPSLTEGTQPKYKYVDGEIIEEVKPLTTEQKIVPIREKRNQLLIASDKYMLSDYPITVEQKALVITFRQALRDMTETVDVDNPIYPVLSI